MTTRIGVDVQSVEEVEKSLNCFGSRYLERVYDKTECTFAELRPRTAGAFLAGHFAAREAVLKLLEIPDAVASWRDIVLIDSNSSPIVELRGESAQTALTLGIFQILMSISSCSDHAIAVAVADVSPFERG